MKATRSSRPRGAKWCGRNRRRQKDGGGRRVTGANFTGVGRFQQRRRSE